MGISLDRGRFLVLRCQPSGVALLPQLKKARTVKGVNSRCEGCANFLQHLDAYLFQNGELGGSLSFRLLYWHPYTETEIYPIASSVQTNLQLAPNMYLHVLCRT